MRTAKRTPRLALAPIVCILSASLLVLTAARPALAEFEIQESTVDEGEIQLQYRSARSMAACHGGSTTLMSSPTMRKRRSARVTSSRSR